MTPGAALAVDPDTGRRQVRPRLGSAAWALERALGRPPPGPRTPPPVYDALAVDPRRTPGVVRLGLF
ncbi:hypothetical protein AB0A66_10565 [Streptomyces longwoodensis]|uniref:hypothetical protein n=1 Tax=Streptomyces longwoodensis TaxID=68231 RepID=UPI0033F60D4E